MVPGESLRARTQPTRTTGRRNPNPDGTNTFMPTTPGPRVAVVTGATRGIGRACAERLTADGHTVHGVGTTLSPPTTLPPGVRYHQADLGDPDDVDRLTAVLAALRPAILVNNAGINVKGGTTTFNDVDYDRLLDVNLRAPFVLIRAVLPGMVEAGWGRIVNVTSMWGSTLGNPADAAYCASKTGLAGLTLSLAAEVARHGVLVNAVAPGFTLTDAAEAAYTPAELDAVADTIPVGRLARPDEVAALVAWLCSGENTYLTGQEILIDGGLSRAARP